MKISSTLVDRQDKNILQTKFLLKAESSHSKKGLILHFKNITIDFVGNYVKLSSKAISQMNIQNVDIS